jgi:peptidoglycan/xylan/chitin deacetylase (PgdA/CDA1 family)
MLRPYLCASPLLALALGSWVGLRRPAACPTASTPEAHPAPMETPQSTVNVSLLPDPTPWPQLNPEASLSRAWLLAEGPAQEPSSGRRLVTFTFDDGPFPETTPVVLHVLAKHQVHAAFFWIGRYLDGDSDRAAATRRTALEVRDAGHLIGNHTHDHAHLTSLSHAEALAQISDGATSIERVVGMRPSLFRPPYGQLDAYAKEIVRAEGLEVVLWNIEVEDLRHDDPKAMAESLETQIEFSGGGIVLLHDIRFTTAETLDRVLTWLDRRRYDPAKPGVVGYDVVDFVDFMRETAKAPQPYADRHALEDARAAAWRKANARLPIPNEGSSPSEDFETM